ncbi:MAG TPA: hypothetical protein VI729_11425 [Anaerolineales bacterium]|nr:hypothetical protein [Anaerolineales bacterium]
MFFTFPGFDANGHRHARESRKQLVAMGLLPKLQSEFTALDCTIDDRRSTEKGYYVELCFRIVAMTESGKRPELVDSGSVAWTRQLLSNIKERLVISGIGSEGLCNDFQLVNTT